MEWKIDESIREKVLKFKGDYERLFSEMTDPMGNLSEEVIVYLKQNNLWGDQEAILNVICVLPGCHFRHYLYSHYYKITDKPDEIITNPECKVWKVDREILLKIQSAAEEYEERENCLRQMRDAFEKEIFQYLQETGLWDNAEALVEMRLLLPTCLIQHKLDERWYELYQKENGADGN